MPPAARKSLATFPPPPVRTEKFAAGAIAAVGSLDTLPAGFTYPNGSTFTSADGRFRLIMQGDGNLVQYQGNTAIWYTRTFGVGNRLAVQTDGNIVIYGAQNQVYWASYTGSTAPSRVVVQNDGNLVYYDKYGDVVWQRSDSPLAGGVNIQSSIQGTGNFRDDWTSADGVNRTICEAGRCRATHSGNIIGVWQAVLWADKVGNIFQ